MINWEEFGRSQLARTALNLSQLCRREASDLAFHRKAVARKMTGPHSHRGGHWFDPSIAHQVSPYPAARHQLVSAQRLRSLQTYAIPHVALQARIELARAHLALADPAGAATLMREIDELLKRRPGLGALTGDAAGLRAQLSKERGPRTPAASALTAAELRVLPMLATHLSFPEIGAEMFLSPHTVKSQAMSIYRKLGASARASPDPRARSGNGRSGRAVRWPSAVHGLGRVGYGHAAAEGPAESPAAG